MQTITIEIDDTDYAVLKTNMVSVQEWVEAVVQAKIRKVSAKVLVEQTELNPLKLQTQEEKRQVIVDRNLDLTSVDTIDDTPEEITTKE